MIYQPGGLLHVFNTGIKIVSYRFQSSHCICIIYFLTLFPFKRFYLSFVEILLLKLPSGSLEVNFGFRYDVSWQHVRAGIKIIEKGIK